MISLLDSIFCRGLPEVSSAALMQSFHVLVESELRWTH